MKTIHRRCNSVGIELALRVAILLSCCLYVRCAEASCTPWDGTPGITSECGITRLNSFPEGHAVCSSGRALVCKGGGWIADDNASCDGKADTPSPAHNPNLPESCDGGNGTSGTGGAGTSSGDSNSGGSGSGAGGDNSSGGDNGSGASSGSNQQVPGPGSDSATLGAAGLGTFAPDGQDNGSSPPTQVDPSTLSVPVEGSAPPQIKTAPPPTAPPTPQPAASVPANPAPPQNNTGSNGNSNSNAKICASEEQALQYDLNLDAQTEGQRTPEEDQVLSTAEQQLRSALSQYHCQ